MHRATGHISCTAVLSYSPLRTSNDNILICTTWGLYEYSRSRDEFNTVKEVPHYIFYTAVFRRQGRYHLEKKKKKKIRHGEGRIIFL